MKKVRSMFRIMLILFFIISIGNILFNVYAFGVKDLTGNQISDQGVNDFGNMIITVLTVIGTSVSVIVIIILGLKYMMGSVEEKAEYKKSMIPYLIGASFVFSSTVIASIVYNISKEIAK